MARCVRPQGNRVGSVITLVSERFAEDVEDTYTGRLQLIHTDAPA